MKEKFLIKKTKIRVIGIGGGGGSVVSELAKRIKKVSFIAANTDIQALRKSPKNVHRFKFGQDLTNGLGTGMDAGVGKIAAENEKQRIKRILKNQDLCIFIACLGGGAGSGAAPVFIETSNDLGNINLGIFTMPFKFEGERRIKIARESLEKLKPHLNGLLVIQNQRIFRIIDKKASLDQAFLALNKILAENLASFIELIYKPGLVNIDFADFKTVLEGRGERIYFNAAEAKGPNRAEAVAKKVLNSPLLDFNIRTAKRILFNISASSDLKMREVERICDTFSNLNKQSKIIFGVSTSPPKQKSEIKVTLLVTGDKKRKKPLEVKKPPEPKEIPKTEAVPESEEAVKKKKKAKSRKKLIKAKSASKEKKKKKRRHNALEIKKAAQKEEEERWAEEEKWDVPAFLRRSPWKEKIKTFHKEKKKS